ncbi:MAG: cyclic-di-AMP receptor [Anaerolineae bacterium]
MKLLLAIVRDDAAAEVTSSLTEAGLSATRVSTTGGFLRRGNVTLLIGVDENQLDSALQVIDAHAGPGVDPAQAESEHPAHRATVFVLDVLEAAHY